MSSRVPYDPCRVAHHDDDRLDSWKEIASHLGRSVRTVRRWEAHEELPVHRQAHRSRATVYGYRSEIDAWQRKRDVEPAPKPGLAEVDPGHRSIAVLPFSYLGPDPRAEYLADGFTDEVISHLGKLAGLRVISRTSVMAFRATTKTARAIGRELQVQHLVEGTVRHDGSRLRVSTRLIAIPSDDRVWAETHDGTLEDVFAMQESIAREIVDALQLRLTPDEDRLLGERPVNDLSAWRAILEARKQTLRWRPDTIDRAIGLLHDALDVVGANAELYAALGRAHLQFREAGVDLGPEPIEQAERFARKAFALAPSSSPVLHLRGWIHYSRGEIQEAVRDLGRALETDRNDPDTLGLLGNCYLISGRVAAARPLIARLLAIDPLTPLNRCMPGWAHALEGNFPAAVAPYREMFEMDPDNPLARLFYTWILTVNRLDQDARRVAAGFTDSQRGSLPARIASRFVGAVAGPGEAGSIELSPDDEKLATTNEMFARFLGQAFALAGHADEAVRWLSVAVDRGFINYPFLAQHDPILRRLDDHPAFRDLLHSVEKRWMEFESQPLSIR
jgi:TolB-like protein